MYNRRGSVTAKALAKELGLKAVRDDKWSSDNHGHPLVRWGASMITRSSVRDQCINAPNAIYIAAHGLKMLRALRDAEVNCPEYYPASNFDKDYDLYETLLARRINHVGGKDIKFVNCNHDLYEALDEGYPYFVKYIETSMELRVHVFGGEVLKAFKKINDDPDASFIRSSYRGWHFQRVDIESHYPKAISVALSAVEALGLTFGAVDMAWSREEKKWYVWEVNSAPSLNSETLSLYVEKFREYLGLM
jgi:glutathione synthase/RimK-type ligase-like ATP-grasp enzyme